MKNKDIIMLKIKENNDRLSSTRDLRNRISGLVMENSSLKRTLAQCEETLRKYANGLEDKEEAIKALKLIKEL